MIIPKHLFEPYVGAKSREAPANLRPVGTGPYSSSTSSRATSLRGEINTDYHVPKGRTSTRSR